MHGQQVTDFSIPAIAGSADPSLATQFTLSGCRGKHLILYFYPKDSTPGCTTEAMEFRDLYAEFVARGALVAGVSRDSLKSHANFREKLQLPFPLLADSDETLCRQFDVIRQKKLYGRDVRGIERSTFLIDPKSRLIREWRGIKAPGHAAEVLAALAEVGG